MSKDRKKTPVTDDIDDILTDEQIASMRPVKDVDPALYKWAVKRGRPAMRPEDKKKTFTIKLSSDMIKSIRESGRGYSARVEHVLRDAVSKGLI